MKISRIYYLLMLVMVTSLSSCDKDDDVRYPKLGEDPRNLSEVLSETSELSSFWQAIMEAQLDSTLRHTSTYTVFPPNNAAFGGVISSELSEEELNNLLLNHIINAATADFTSTFTTGYRTTMATGPDDNNLSIFINAEGDARLNGVASLVTNASNIGSTNGVLHVIDGVLAPPTVVDHLEANPDFSMFLAALEAAELLDSLVINDEENESFPFTVFAPTNAAFGNLMSQLNGVFGWETIQDIPTEVLQEIIMFHVITGSNTISAEAAGTEITTLEGSTFSIGADNIITDASYTTGSFVHPDIQGINGIIHAIDKVLLTENVVQDVLDLTLNIRERLEDRGFNTFLAAAEKAGLNTSLETDELTVFAPTNAAFETLFGRLENFENLEDFDTDEELELLRNLLEYHLHSGTVLTSQLTDGSLSTVLGGNIMVETGSGSLIPSHEHASRASFARTNIGATNGVIHEIGNVLVPADLAEALGFPVPSTGGPEYGFEIYHDGLNSDFWVGWTDPDFSNPENVYSGIHSIRLDYAGWEALQLGMDAAVAEELTPYSTLDFAVYSETGVEVLVALNGQDANGETINVPAGEWTQYSIPLANIANGESHLNQLVIQMRTGDAGTIFFDQIGLDVTGGGNAAPEFDLPIYYDNLEPGFEAWGGWGATVTWNSNEVVQNGETSIKVEYFADNWGALQLGNAGNVNATDYTTFNLSVYGAPGSGTTPLVVGLAGVDDGVNVDVIEGEWTTYRIPVSQFPDTSLGEIRIKNNSAEASTIYVDNIGFNN